MKSTTNMGRNSSRNRLLATVSSVALVAAICASQAALADERPALWFELGWDFENVHDSASNIALPLGSMVPQSGLTAPLGENVDLARSYSDEGKITFQPDGSDWVFSASIRYGRAKGKSQINQALAPIPTTSFVSYVFTYPFFPSSNKLRQRHTPKTQEKLSEQSSNSESHFIIDFDAGKDVGLGMFGRHSASVLSAGVRFAHFNLSSQTANFQETQGMHFQSSTFMTTFWPGYGTNRRELWDTIAANGGTSQNFNGLGPSIRWDASAELWEDSQGGLSLDWGANAALLFGPQKKRIHAQATSADHCAGGGCPAHQPVYTSSVNTRTSKNITVPNVGGFAGFSLNYKDVKVSLGYRADLFVNAIDVGFATRKSSNMLLHGPFASLSIGLGD